MNAGLSIRTVAQSVAKSLRERLGVRHQLDLLPLLVRLDQLLLLATVLGVEVVAPLGVDQPFDDADAARGVEHVDRRLLVGRRDLHGRVLGAGRGAADQQRQLDPLPLHFAGHVDHFVQAGRDQAR